METIDQAIGEEKARIAAEDCPLWLYSSQKVQADTWLDIARNLVRTRNFPEAAKICDSIFEWRYSLEHFDDNRKELFKEIALLRALIRDCAGALKTVRCIENMEVREDSLIQIACLFGLFGMPTEDIQTTLRLLFETHFTRLQSKSISDLLSQISVKIFESSPKAAQRGDPLTLVRDGVCRCCGKARWESLMRDLAYSLGDMGYREYVRIAFIEAGADDVDAELSQIVITCIEMGAFSNAQVWVEYIEDNALQTQLSQKIKQAQLAGDSTPIGKTVFEDPAVIRTRLAPQNSIPADRVDRTLREVLQKIAVIQAETGEGIEAARKTLTAVFDLAQKLQTGGEQSEAFCAIAVTQARIGDIDRAIQMVHKQLPMKFEQSIPIREIAINQARTGDYNGVLQTAQEHLGAKEQQEVFQEIILRQAKTGDNDGILQTVQCFSTPKEQVNVLLETAEIRIQSSDFNGACKLLITACEIARNLGLNKTCSFVLENNIHHIYNHSTTTLLNSQNIVKKSCQADIPLKKSAK